jgi:hypothetical protein
MRSVGAAADVSVGGVQIFLAQSGCGDVVYSAFFDPHQTHERV